MSNYKLAIFDLDGTLVDTREDLANAVNHALAAGGFPQHTVEECRMMVGEGIRNLCMRALPEKFRDNTAVLDSTLAAFVDYYSSHCTVRSWVYPGMVDLLQKLSGRMMLAVASNKFQEGTAMIVEHYFPGINFTRVCGGRSGVPLKPDPQVVHEIIAAAGVSPEETVMIGDSGVDLRTAASAGINCIGVTWGFRPEQAAAATQVASTAEELGALLL